MTNRDASYTTQPLELLNALGFENPKNHAALNRDSEINKEVSPYPKSVDTIQGDNHRFNFSDNGNSSPIVSDGTIQNINASVVVDHNQEMGSQTNTDGSEGL